MRVKVEVILSCRHLNTFENAAPRAMHMKRGLKIAETVIGN